MRKLNLLSIAFCLSLSLLPAHLIAATYDGSVPLLCATVTVLECEETGECQRRTAESVNLPQFVKVNAQQQTLSAVGQSETTTPIKRLEHLDGRLILQGGESGRGWSLVITEETGKLSAAIVEDGGTFVIFGACIPQ